MQLRYWVAAVVSSPPCTSVTAHGYACNQRAQVRGIGTTPDRVSCSRDERRELRNERRPCHALRVNAEALVSTEVHEGPETPGDATRERRLPRAADVDCESAFSTASIADSSRATSPIGSRHPRSCDLSPSVALRPTRPPTPPHAAVAMIIALDRDFLQLSARRVALVAEVAAYKRAHRSARAASSRWGSGR